MGHHDGRGSIENCCDASTEAVLERRQESVEANNTGMDRIAAPAVELIGSVRDTPPRYREADVFVSPSVSDNLPNTVLESMACGVPLDRPSPYRQA